MQTYHVASDFTAGTAVPSVVWAWNKTYVFLDGTVWPKMRILYTENVEHQLVRIGERLGRYKESRTKSTVNSVAQTTAR